LTVLTVPQDITPLTERDGKPSIVPSLHPLADGRMFDQEFGPFGNGLGGPSRRCGVMGVDEAPEADQVGSSRRRPD
jgi:hypothetical protein